MIVKIKITEKGKTFYMLFGDSYKKWEVQFREYVSMFYAQQIIVSVSVSQEQWISWGGLKWCNEDEFQEELNREGVQDNEADNINARIYAEMSFYFCKSTSEKAFDIVHEINKQKSKSRKS